MRPSDFSRSKRLMAGILLTLLVAGCSVATPPTTQLPSAPGGQDAPPPTPVAKVQAGYAAASASFAAMYVAQEAGLFPKYGLEAEVTFLQSGAATTRALMAGQIDFGGISASHLVNADMGGAELVFLAKSVDKLPYLMFGRPEIRSIADLRGKKVGIATFGGVVEAAARYALGRHGLEPGRDVSLLQMEKESARLAALETGAVDATLFNLPWNFQAEKAGFPILLDFRELDFLYMQSGLAANRSFVSQQRDVAKRFLKAFVEGLSIFKRDRVVAQEALKKYTMLEDLEMLAKTQEFYAAVFEEVPYVRAEALNPVVAEAIRGRDAPGAEPEVQQMFDNSVLRELEEEGFIKALYSR